MSHRATTTSTRTTATVGRVARGVGRVLSDCHYASRRSYELQAGLRNAR